MEIGLFPLELVLLPTERVPLHIFEPRYRELIEECLAREAEFGIVLADERGLRAVGTRAHVADVLERFPDGRLNILIQGGGRFRVVELIGGRSFQTAQIETVADGTGGPADEAVERGLKLFRELREASTSPTSSPPASTSAQTMSRRRGSERISSSCCFTSAPKSTRAASW